MKKIMVVVLALLMLFMPGMPVMAAMSDGTLNDISGQWYEEFVSSFINSNIFVGKGKIVEFRPETNASREECINMAVAHFGLNEARTLPFTDANQISQSYYSAVQTAYAKGVVSGYENNTLRPKSNITRVEACLIAVKASGRTITIGISPKFNDTIPDWGKDIVGYSQSIGIIKGYPDGTFKPNKSVTRAEFATMLYKLAAMPPAFTQLPPNTAPNNGSFQQLPADRAPNGSNSNSFQQLPADPHPQGGVQNPPVVNTSVQQSPGYGTTSGIQNPPLVDLSVQQSPGYNQIATISNPQVSVDQPSR